jgi:NAD(P)-dependent dehydrogenase (short-subunit alcohol dehydrogenase family)
MSPKVDHGESSYIGTGRLEGRRALITGQTAVLVARLRLPLHEGADVGDQRLVTEFGRKAILLPGETSETKGVIQRAIDGLGAIAILVNNAAFQ